MSERIHLYLDGELAYSDLTADERREAEAYERVIERALSLAEGEEVPDVTDAVMARIEGEASSAASPEGAGSVAGRRVGSVLRGLWEPRPVRLRPAYGILAAAALLLLVLIPGQDGAPEVAGGAEATGEALEAPGALVFVQFRFEAPEASTVELAGTFTGWQPDHALHEVAPGVWSILVPLPPGIHEYSFVVDEREWVADPIGPRVDDGFGGANSRITILPPYGGRES